MICTKSIIYENVYFSVNALLTYNAVPYNGMCMISLSEEGGDTILGNSTVFSESGSASFNISFANPGKKTIIGAIRNSTPVPDFNKTLDITIVSYVISILDFKKVLFI